MARGKLTLDRFANIALVVALAIGGPILLWQWNNSRIARAQLAAGQQLGQIVVGDVIGRLEITTADGSRPLVTESVPPRTLALVFASDCGFCEAVATNWAEWLGSPPSGVRIVALSYLDLETESAYAEAKGWPVEVGVVSGINGSLAHRVTARTPWLFVLDAEGVVLYEAAGYQEGATPIFQIPTELFGDES